MISITLARVYLYLVALLSIGLAIYFWHYRPMGELQELKEDAAKAEVVNKLETVKADSFTDKYKTIKEQIQTAKEKHDEINTSIGKHRIYFE